LLFLARASAEARVIEFEGAADVRRGFPWGSFQIRDLRIETEHRMAKRWLGSKNDLDNEEHDLKKEIKKG
jgi:hypothetical protein